MTLTGIPHFNREGDQINHVLNDEDVVRTDGGSPEVAAGPQSRGAATPLAEVPPDQLHTLLLLADSALPLGSFAFSAGLESFLAHQPVRGRTAANFHHFLTLSLSSLATTSLPYVVAAHQEPWNLTVLDNDYDASTTCTVARRASVKQGRALVTVWERSFRSQVQQMFHQRSNCHTSPNDGRDAMNNFCTALKAATEDDIYSPNGHLAPLFGAFSALLQVPLQHVLYIFLLNHAKALVSAAIRASVLGPYQAQTILAGGSLRQTLQDLVTLELRCDTGSGSRPADPRTSRVAEAGQSVPMLDLWGGRHEIVYSRIFNS